MARSRHRWACAFGIILLGCRLPAATAGAARPPEPATLEVGSLTLHRCETEAPWCGTLVRRLDPANAPVVAETPAP